MHNPLEEFPPQERSRPPQQRGRARRAQRDSGSVNGGAGNGDGNGDGHGNGHGNGNGGLPIATIALIALLVVALSGITGSWLWTDHRLAQIEGELADARASLDDAGNSLRLLWATTTQLDSTRIEGQELLAGSIGSVKQFAESEVTKLWETAYVEHERRLDETARRISAADQSIRQILATSGRTTARLDGLARQNQLQDADLNGMAGTVTTLRETLAILTGEVEQLAGQLVTSQQTQVRLGSRVDGVEQWVGGFREAGLDAGAVRDRLSSLVRDLRTMTLRVDSLKIATDSTRGRRAQTGQ
jgi:chromosome segregation ATPase